MNEIKIATGDCKIWNPQQKTFEILTAARSGPVVIDLLHEGPCCDTIGLNQLLDQICNFLNVPQSHFVIKTSNQLSSSHYQEIRTQFVELKLAKQKIATTVPSISSLDKRFGIFIGRSNWQRLGLASHLWKYHKDKLVITYHYNNAMDYHQANFGLETLLQKNWHTRHIVYEFLEQLPITMDYQTYPILWDQGAFDLDEHYKQIFCEVVCETFFTGKTFMMTEKIMRPIIQHRPFVVQGPKFFLENLKILGFKTFDAWWDENYDSDGPDGQFESMRWTLDYIRKQSSQTIKDWYHQMQPVLEHNAKVLLQLTDQQIVTANFKSE
jgi:hypothetical protein